MKAKLFARSPRQAASFIEPLESRITPGAITFPSVLSINRAVPTSEGTAANEVTFTVVFDQAVTGVDASDFKAFTSVDAKAIPPVTVTPTADPKIFNVKISGLQGNGDVRLDLVDDDTIKFGAEFLGGAGAKNGSFTGQTYHLLQTMPKVNSITATVPNPTSAGTVSWTVTFSEPVTGVDATDFTYTTTGVTTPGTPTVTPVAGTNGAGYLVTVTGFTGTGTLGLNLVDDGTIKDSDKNPLQTVQLPNPPTNPGVSFGQPQTATAGNGPISIASGDVNGDGKPDIAVLNGNYTPGSGYTVSVLLGIGDGTFQPKQDFAVGNNPRSVAIADVNGDGKPDLVVTGQTFDVNTSASHFVSVLLGDGLGGFAPKTDWGNSFSSPGALAVGDMNHDGKPDLVVLTTSGNSIVNVLLGNGDGTFQTEQTFAVNKSSNDVQIADVNGDGIPDVITANFLDESVSVLLGTGTGAVTDTGSLGTATAFSVRGVDDQANPNAVAVGDMNGDGKPDLVTAGYYSYYNADEPHTYTGGSVTVMLGDGSGNFAFKDSRGGGRGLSDVQLADFNGDGKLDIAASDNQKTFIPSNPSSNPVSVRLWLGDGDGNIGNGFSFTTSASKNESLTVADFNGDGKADLATANGSVSISGSPAEPGIAPATGPSSGTADALLNIGTGPFTGETFAIVPPFVDPTITGISDGVTSAATGDLLMYTIGYANKGNTGATGVTLTVPLDTHYFFVASENPGWSETGGTLTKTLPGTLAAGAGVPTPLTETLKLHVKQVIDYANASAIATVTISDDGTHGTDADPKNNSASDNDQLTGQVYGGFVVTAPGISPKLNKFALPVVRVFDRITGAEIYSFTAYEDTYRDSIRVALGDFNQDGVDDIVTTTQHNGGRMRFFDGATGTQFTSGPLSEEIPVFGVSTSKTSKNKGAFVAVGNVNGFGFPEIVVGSSLITAAVGGGTVQVYSLDTVQDELTKVKEFTPFGAKFKGGVRVAVADVDGFNDTGKPGSPESSLAPFSSRFEDDIIVGQGFHGATVKVYKGTVVDSTAGQEETAAFKLGEFTVGKKGFKGGVSVAAGDINNDGHADILVGRNTGKPSVVELFDGLGLLGKTFAQGSVLPQIGTTLNPFDVDPKHPKTTSGVRVALADVNGDGVADIIASVGIKKNSLIKFYDGKEFRAGNIVELTSPTHPNFPITAFSDFPDVALWVAASRQILE